MFLIVLAMIFYLPKKIKLWLKFMELN